MDEGARPTLQAGVADGEVDANPRAISWPALASRAGNGYQLAFGLRRCTPRRGGSVVSGVGAAGLEQVLNLRVRGQDEEREPVIASVALQVQQVLDLAGVEQARLEPPPGQAEEDVAQCRLELFLPQDAGPEDGAGHGPEGAVDLAGLVRIVESGLVLDRDAQLLAERRGDGVDQRDAVGIARVSHRLSPRAGWMRTSLRLLDL